MATAFFSDSVMRYRALVLLLLSPLAGAGAQSQLATNARAADRARAADSTLNAVYRQLEAKYRADTLALRKLRAAERAWLAFRDAQIEATYPAADKPRAYGSVLPMCISGMLEELTRARIAQLRQALRPQEGDVCAGGSP